MPATLTYIPESNFAECTNLQVVDLSLCTSVPNGDSNSAFYRNGENREVTVYVASGMRDAFLNYCPEEDSWTTTYPWQTLKNESRIKIVEKE